MAGGEQRLELLGLDLGAQTQGGTAVSPPAARRLGRIEVVVDGTTADGVPAGVVGGQAAVVGQQAVEAGAGRLEGGGPHHGRPPPGRNALVCAWWGSMQN
jgi:hypothetical protein